MMGLHIAVGLGKERAEEWWVEVSSCSSNSSPSPRPNKYTCK